MPNSQEQSLDEDVVFLPVSESSPQFLYCEKERRCVERLLSSGPEAFYSSISTELSSCFLSPEEISQMSRWAQDYRFQPPPVEMQSSTPPEDFCSTYLPPNSDVPTPDLELGWPEKDSWPVEGSATVHTNPPAEGDPPIREIIRQHLQRASKVGLSKLQHIFTLHVWFIPTGIICHLKWDVVLRVYSYFHFVILESRRSFGVRNVVFTLQVVAIVTDRLTDCAIIEDLHGVASRGVAIYVILNQRTFQENFTLKKLRHPVSRLPQTSLANANIFRNI